MKKYIIILIVYLGFVYSIQGCFAQKVVIANIKMNSIYVGVSNALDIAVAGYQCGEIMVSAVGEDIMGQDCQYSISPREAGPLDIVVTVLKNKKIIKCDTIKYYRIFFPNPQLKISCNNVVNSTPCNVGLLVIPVLENFDFDIRFQIKSYELTWKRGVEIMTIKVSGSEIPLKVESGAIKGDNIIIDNVWIIGPDKERKLGPINIYAKGRL
jgi:hypothetical protein